MANTLIITKETGNFFSLKLNAEDIISSDQNRLTTVGNYCHFKTGTGANLIKEQNVLYSEITLIASGTFTFSSVNDLWVKLIEVGFFDGLGIGSGGAGVDRFDELLDTFQYTGRDGQVLIVNESQQKLTTAIMNVFTQAYKDKLDGIEAEAQKNVQADMLENDPTSDAYIKNKTSDYLNSVGWFIYNDLATQTTPISFVSGVDKKLTNDAAGAGSNSLFAPFGIGDIWDNAANQLNLSQLSVGDIVNIRLLLETTTTAANQTYNIKVKSAIGSPIEDFTAIHTDSEKNAGVKKEAFSIQVVVSSDNIKNFPSEFYINSDGNGTIKVKGFLFSIIRRNVNIIDLSTDALNLKEDTANKITAITGSSTTKYTSEKAVKDYVDSNVASLYKIKGSVANFASLPSSGQIVGDVWNTTDTGMNYVWTGSVWDALGTTVDISGKEDKTNKTDNVTGSESDTSKYPSLLGFTSWIRDTMPQWLSPKATSLVDTDLVLVADGSDSYKAKTRTFAQLKATLKTYFDGFYMDLTNSQTVSGVKTFNEGKLGLRNVANTFTSFFTNSNTVSRTYTLPDASGNLVIDTTVLLLTGNQTYSGTKTSSQAITSLSSTYTGSSNFTGAIQAISNGGGCAIVSSNTGGTGLRMDSGGGFTIRQFLSGASIGISMVADATGDLINATSTAGSILRFKVTNTGDITGKSLIITGGTVRLFGYTVATLPVGTIGDTAYVTDAISPTYLGALTGGGTVKCPVFYNGTAWVSH